MKTDATSYIPKYVERSKEKKERRSELQRVAWRGVVRFTYN